ncbi:hypothetical protein ACFQ9X_03380 [Catenulispora yoronensis]
MSKRAKARALDIGHPLVVLVRGSKQMAADAKTYWAEAGGHEKHKEWRDLVVFVFAVCAVAAGFQPYGVLLLIAVWPRRPPTWAGTVRTRARTRRPTRTSRACSPPTTAWCPT